MASFFIAAGVCVSDEDEMKTQKSLSSLNSLSSNSLSSLSSFSSPRAQIALWMLTKMAMVFFVLALALVLVGLSNKEKAGLCTARAESVVQNVRSQVVGIVSAPIEDERKVIPLERILATGSEDFQKYNLTVTWRKALDGNESLTFETVALSENCRAGSSMAVADVAVHMPGAALKSSQSSAKTAVLTVEPSKKYGSTDPPSLYLIVLKCSSKSIWPPINYLFIEDCRREKPDECSLNFNNQLIDECCGWAAPPGSRPASCRGLGE